MHYLVTGGAGFIGSHLTEALLQEGNTVTVLDDLSSGKREHLWEAITFHEGSITNYDLVETLVKKVDGVFHLAAIPSVTRSIEEWSVTHRINQMGAVNVFEVAAKYNLPVVYASSAAVYGDNEQLPLHEESETDPLSPYGLDKLACEWQAKIGHRIKGLNAIGLRFFNVFGPRQDPKSAYSGVISIFVDRLRNKESLLIFGDGEQTRDFIYVRDIIHAMNAAMQKLHQEDAVNFVSNLCTGQSVSLNQLANKLMAISEIEVEVEYQFPREGDIMHSLGSPDRMQKAFGPLTNTNLDEGLEALWKSLS
jgi:UDP-glucose 4-epimerase